MSAAQMLDERGSNSRRVSIVIGKPYQWRRVGLEPTMRDSISRDVAPKPGSIDGFASLETAVHLEGRL